MTTITDDDVKSILRTVQDKLTRLAEKTGIDLRVSSEESRREDDWLYVVVSPGHPGIRAYDYVSTLGEVERELKEEGGLTNILLVPAIAEW